ncbi:hypothetical protein V8C42DRAFT_313712 [Trichoderma barbatum]
MGWGFFLGMVLGVGLAGENKRRKKKSEFVSGRVSLNRCLQRAFFFFFQGGAGLCDNVSFLDFFFGIPSDYVAAVDKHTGRFCIRFAGLPITGHIRRSVRAKQGRRGPRSKGGLSV